MSFSRHRRRLYASDGSPPLQAVCQDCHDRRRHTALWSTDDPEVIRHLCSGIGVDPEYLQPSFPSFDDDGLRQLDRATVRARRGLLVHGKAGSHKTHLLCARAVHFARHGLTAKVVPWLELSMEIRATYRQGSELSELDVFDKYTGLDYLGLDDIGVGLPGESASSASYRFCYTLLDKRKRLQRTTDLATNLDPKGLAEFFQDSTGRIMRRLVETAGAMEMGVRHA